MKNSRRRLSQNSLSNMNTTLPIKEIPRILSLHSNPKERKQQLINSRSRTIKSRILNNNSNSKRIKSNRIISNQNRIRNNNPNNLSRNSNNNHQKHQSNQNLKRNPKIQRIMWNRPQLHHRKNKRSLMLLIQRKINRKWSRTIISQMKRQRILPRNLVLVVDETQSYLSNRSKFKKEFWKWDWFFLSENDLIIFSPKLSENVCVSHGKLCLLLIFLAYCILFIKLIVLILGYVVLEGKSGRTIVLIGFLEAHTGSKECARFAI